MSEKTGRFESFFPYPEFKPPQLPVMEFVFDVVGREEIGLVEAYCGFGKTIATLAPVFEQGKKVLLLSPTHLARNAGIAEALRQEAHFSQGFFFAISKKRLKIASAILAFPRLLRNSTKGFED